MHPVFFSVLSSAPGMEEVQTLLSVIRSNQVGYYHVIMTFEFRLFDFVPGGGAYIVRVPSYAHLYISVYALCFRLLMWILDWQPETYSIVSHNKTTGRPHAHLHTHDNDVLCSISLL